MLTLNPDTTHFLARHNRSSNYLTNTLFAHKSLSSVKVHFWFVVANFYKSLIQNLLSLTMFLTWCSFNAEYSIKWALFIDNDCQFWRKTRPNDWIIYKREIAALCNWLLAGITKTTCEMIRVLYSSLDFNWNLHLNTFRNQSKFQLKKF